MSRNEYWTRRLVLQRGLQLGAMGVAAPLAINLAAISDSLRQDLHTLRKYRNRWVHVSAPHDDAELLVTPQIAEEELERMAHLAVRSLRMTIYSDQWL